MPKQSTGHVLIIAGSINLPCEFDRLPARETRIVLDAVGTANLCVIPEPSGEGECSASEWGTFAAWKLEKGRANFLRRGIILHDFSWLDHVNYEKRVWCSAAQRKSMRARDVAPAMVKAAMESVQAIGFSASLLLITAETDGPHAEWRLFEEAARTANLGVSRLSWQDGHWNHIKPT